jgi:hypothetical protein
MKYVIALLMLGLPLAAAQSLEGPQEIQRGAAIIQVDAGMEEATTGVDPAGPVMETSWKSGDLAMRVSTPRRTGEDSNEQARRHRIACDALLRIYPPGTSDE